MKSNFTKILTILFFICGILTMHALIDNIIYGWTYNIMFRAVIGIVTFFICYVALLDEQVSTLEKGLKELKSEVRE